MLKNHVYLWTGQGTFLVPDFHRPNGAKILRFGNFPHTLPYPRGVKNCQESKSFSKIWLWKSWTFGYFFGRTRKPPHFQYIWAVMTMMGVVVVEKMVRPQFGKGQGNVW